MLRRSALQASFVGVAIRPPQEFECTGIRLLCKAHATARSGGLFQLCLLRGRSAGLGQLPAIRGWEKRNLQIPIKGRLVR